ncbi:hypothetical protein Poli38472_002716 [Pythium oligandrum]|uniref:WDR5-like beta-propeller domain-containing protein n=1 Tax=Pythium oligandrum TaxID=41045 RepID=A0A8K1CIC7_PYTOL|nr:hypothetical protein Poli38472_002716 [Pythium oligandrum]|eukprot:TMW63775.1 hypothetical protein Poli38472_002716 [Pythium oligandrum]
MASTTTPTWTAQRSITAHSKPISSVKFSRDGSLVATASADGIIKIWSTTALLDASSECKPSVTFHDHDQGVSDVSWSPDGAYIVSASDDKTVRVWDVEQHKAVSVLGTPTHSNSVLFSGLPMDSDALAAHAGDDTDDGHTSFVFCCQVNPQGTLIASGSFDETVRLWDLRSGKCLVDLTVHQEPVSCVDFNCDGTLLATASYDGLVRVWDVATMQCLREIILDPSVPVTQARFTPNSRYLLVGSLDHQLALWDYTTPQKPRCVKRFQGHVNQKFCLSAACFQDPEGDMTRACVLSGSEDGRVVVWDIEMEEKRDEWVVPGETKEPVLGLSVHPTEPIVVTGSGRTLTLWRKA